MKIRASPEHDSQVAVIDWWAWMHKSYKLPEFALYAVPNGSFLAGDVRRRAMQAARLKREGLRSGIPDLALPVARGSFHGMVIEMKSAAGHQSKSQTAVLTWFVEAGWRVHTCRSADMAILAIKNYLDLPPQ